MLTGLLVMDSMNLRVFSNLIIIYIDLVRFRTKIETFVLSKPETLSKLFHPLACGGVASSITQ